MSRIYDDDGIYSGYALGGAFAICLAVVFTIITGSIGFLWWLWTRFL